MSVPAFNWTSGFYQRNGKEICYMANEQIYHITSLHRDVPSVGSMLFVLKGHKRFYIVPPQHEKAFL
jgi:hypothetical protein